MLNGCLLKNYNDGLWKIKQRLVLSNDMVIPYARQSITKQDIDAVTEVLQSEYLTQGPIVPTFEDAVADLVGAKYAIAGNSATSMLHVACLALGVTNGDLVWTSPISFVASANCALYCGAQIDFVDIDSETFNMSPTALAAKLEEAQKSNQLPKVIIPVHMGGQSCDMKSIGLLAKQYGIKVIEDASHAIGGSYDSHRIGSCDHSDITIFSFHPVKIITSGEGGMATTQDEILAHRMRMLRSHGITRNETEFEFVNDGPWYYEQQELGLNYRLTDIAAALGLSQLQRIDAFIKQRNIIAARYDEAFASTQVALPHINSDCISAFHLYIARCDFENSNVTRVQLFQNMKNSGVLLNLHYIPIYRQPFYSKMGFDPKSFPNAERYYKQAFSIPMYADLTEADQDTVISSLFSALVNK
jgi:UDP-4-amino-4,6-dideoxy-N-acetyl-beta-L-altrosamine transaminase